MRSNKWTLALFFSVAVSVMFYWLIPASFECEDFEYNPDVISVIYYRSSDNGFGTIMYPQKGDDLASLESQFEAYKVSSGKPNVVLYRDTPKDWCNYGNWLMYLTEPLWRYPEAPN